MPLYGLAQAMPTPKASGIGIWVREMSVYSGQVTKTGYPSMALIPTG